MICMLHLMKLSSHVRWLIFCSVLNVLVPPPPSLELIQLPAKKHSLTTYKEKNPLLLEDSPAFLPHMVVFLYLPGYPLTCSYCLSH